MKRLAIAALMGMALVSGYASATVVQSGSATITNKYLWTKKVSFDDLTAGNYELSLSFTPSKTDTAKFAAIADVLAETRPHLSLKGGDYDLFGGKSFSDTIDFTVKNVADYTLLLGFVALGQGSSWCAPITGWSGKFEYSLDKIPAAPVPEPETYALMGLGLVAVAASRLRRNKK